MAELFGGNAVFVFFFAMIAIYNYSNLKEYQRITIIYVTIFCLRLTDAVTTITAFIYLSIALFCFFEILTDDEKKLQFIINPVYKLLDALYLSLAQYAVLCEVLSISLANYFLKYLFEYKMIGTCYGVMSLIMMVVTVTITLQQRYVVNSFNEMYRVFAKYPLNEFEEDEKLKEASTILVSLEDRLYYERIGYTNFSFRVANTIISERVTRISGNRINYVKNKIVVMINLVNSVIKNIITRKRGYSTIQMQLVRSLGLQTGYNCVKRRKVYEIIYSRIFLDGLIKYFETNNYDGRQNLKQYLVYIYFHTVATYFEDTGFIDFVSALKYLDKKNVSDISDVSNEVIFIACMGLSKNADYWSEGKINEYVGKVTGVELDIDKIMKAIHKKNRKRKRNQNKLLVGSSQYS